MLVTILMMACFVQKTFTRNALNAARENNIQLDKSFMVGDRKKDIIAGASAGCKTIYLSANKDVNADFFVKNHQNFYKLLKKLLKI